MDTSREEVAAGVKGCSERISSFEGLENSPSMVQTMGMEDYRKDFEAVENRAGRSAATVADAVHGQMDRLREDFRELHAQVNAMHSPSHSSQAPMGDGHSIASEAAVNPKAGSKSDYVPPNKEHIPSNGEAMEIGTDSETAKTSTATANVCRTTSLATPPPTHTTLLSTSSGLRITFDHLATPTLAMTVHSELLHWLFNPSSCLKPLRALTPRSSLDFNQLVPSGIADGMAFDEVRPPQNESEVRVPEPGKAELGTGVVGKSADSWFDPDVLETLQNHYRVPVWRPDLGECHWDWETLFLVLALPQGMPF